MRCYACCSSLVAARQGWPGERPAPLSTPSPSPTPGAPLFFAEKLLDDDKDMEKDLHLSTPQPWPHPTHPAPPPPHPRPHPHPTPCPAEKLLDDDEDMKDLHLSSKEVAAAHLLQRRSMRSGTATPFDLALRRGATPFDVPVPFTGATGPEVGRVGCRVGGGGAGGSQGSGIWDGRRWGGREGGGNQGAGTWGGRREGQKWGGGAGGDAHPGRWHLGMGLALAWCALSWRS